MKKRKVTLSSFSIFICVFCVGLSCGIVYAQSYDKVTVFKTQKKLQELGYNPGPLDGIWGKKTESALIRFQHDNSLSMTGKLDPITKKKLGIISLENRVPKQSILSVSIQNGIREALAYTWEIKKIQIKNDILTVVPNSNFIDKKKYASMILEICKYPNVSNQLKEIWILDASQNQGWVLLKPEKCDQIIHTSLDQVDNLIFSYSADVIIFESR